MLLEQRKFLTQGCKKIGTVVSAVLRDDVKKNGKMSDIEQKGGRGLSQIHSF